jgi:hypothetical protein
MEGVTNGWGMLHDFLLWGLYNVFIHCIETRRK